MYLWRNIKDIYYNFN